MNNKKILFVVNDDWFFISHRLPIAIKAKEQGYEVHIATGNYIGESKFEQYGFKHHIFSIARAKVNPFSDLFTIVSLYRLYKLIKPDLVHHITIKPVLFGGIAARLAKVPAVVSAISGLGVIFIEKGVKAKFKLLIVSFLYKLALGNKNAVIITQNPDDQNVISRIANKPLNQMKLIKGSGVDLDQFPFSPIKDTTSFKVVLLARMLKDKGVYEFYQAAKILKKENLKVDFILAGDVHENPSSLKKSELQHWNDGGVVEWIGHQANPTDVLEKSDIVVLPSYREGLPKVLLEAAAIGRPIVTTDVPGCRDAIIPNSTGLLVPVKSVKELSNAIKELLNDFSMRKKFSESGRVMVELEFSIESVVCKHIEIYSELLESQCLKN